MDQIPNFKFHDTDVVSGPEAIDPERGAFGRLEVALNEVIDKVNELIARQATDNET